MKTILCSSGYGANTRRPFVQIESEDLDRPLQLSPEEAQDLALNLLQAAEAALTDGFLVEYATKIIGVDRSAAAGWLVEYREFRDQRRKSKGGGDETRS